MRTLGPPPDPKNPFGRLALVWFGFVMLLGIGFIFTLILALIGFNITVAIIIGMLIAFGFFGKGFFEIFFASFLWLFQGEFEDKIDSILTKSWRLFVIFYMLIPLYTILLVCFLFLIFVSFESIPTFSWFPFGLFITFRARFWLLIAIPIVAYLLTLIPKKVVLHLNNKYTKFVDR